METNASKSIFSKKFFIVQKIYKSASDSLTAFTFFIRYWFLLIVLNFLFWQGFILFGGFIWFWHGFMVIRCFLWKCFFLFFRRVRYMLEISFYNGKVISCMMINSIHSLIFHGKNWKLMLQNPFFLKNSLLCKKFTNLPRIP